MKLKNKVVLVTGGAVRIGRAICLSLAGDGAVVYCHYNSSEPAAFELQNQVKKTGGNLHLLHSDFSDLSHATKMVDEIINQSGRIDILINNAAIFFKTALNEIDEEDWDKLFTVNLKIPFFLSQKIGLLMKQQGFGKIINIGDTSGLNPWPGYLPYSLTKSGIISMTKGLAKALSPEVLVNCINPGPVLIPEYYSEKDIKRSIEKTLLKKTGSAEDIVQTIKYLIEGSDYLTGSVINVDGGRSIN